MLRPTGGQPWRQLWYQVRGRLRYQFGSNLRAKLCDPLRVRVRVQLWYQFQGLDRFQGQLSGQLKEDLQC